ncbi:MAG: phosphate ABC transporter substrate-binding protein PstS [Nitrospirota bacterium]
MKRTLFLSLIAVLAFATPVFAQETVNGAGATFPAPLYIAWAYEYNKVSGVKLNYQSVGSGAGQRQIVERTIDFGASDDPLPSEKLAKDNLIQFPTVIGGITLVVNIPGVKSGEMKLDPTVLSKTFLGEIKTWDDAQIKKLNPGLNLPSTPITVVHRSDGSGTTAIFTHYLAEVSPAWKTKVGEGKSVSWPIGIGGKGNEGVANYVKMTPNSIGYVEFAYAKQNKLVYTKLRNKAGNFVEPNFESFENAAETGNFYPKKDFHVWLTNSPGKTSWPIAGATFILLAKDKKDVNRKAVKFFNWAYTNGDTTAKNLVYIPLPKTLKDKVRAYWKSKGIQ